MLDAKRQLLLSQIGLFFGVWATAVFGAVPRRNASEWRASPSRIRRYATRREQEGAPGTKPLTAPFRSVTTTCGSVSQRHDDVRLRFAASRRRAAPFRSVRRRAAPWAWNGVGRGGSATDRGRLTPILCPLPMARGLSLARSSSSFGRPGRRGNDDEGTTLRNDVSRRGSGVRRRGGRRGDRWTLRRAWISTACRRRSRRASA
jgi:hypothetical protein